MTAGAAGLLVALGDAGAAEPAFKLGFFTIGACMAVLGTALATGRPPDLAFYADRSEPELGIPSSVVYIAIGAGLIAIGFALDVLL
jgi:hypothetical protein